MYCFWCLWWGDINKIEYTCKRPKSKVSSQNVIVQEENEAPHLKERFLPNNNKSQLISLLSEYLTSDDQMVHICRGDAATKSVSTALELSNGSNEIVAADDTDDVIMLLYHLLCHHQNKISDICFPWEWGKQNAAALKKLSKKLIAKNICKIISLTFAKLNFHEKKPLQFAKLNLCEKIYYVHLYSLYVVDILFLTKLWK